MQQATPWSVVIIPRSSIGELEAVSAAAAAELAGMKGDAAARSALRLRPGKRREARASAAKRGGRRGLIRVRRQQ
jgi:hypothetical protein